MADPMESKPLLSRQDSRAPEEESPAYEVLVSNNLLTTRYRLEDIDAIEARQSNTTIGKMMCCRAASCVVPCLGYMVYRCIVHEFEVPRGYIRLIEDGRGSFYFCGPGLHRIVDPFYRVGRRNIPVNNAVIKHGDRSLIVVEQGCIGFCTDKGMPVLLPPGLHQWMSQTLTFERSVDLNNALIKLGPYTLLTVDEGYSAVTQNNGRMTILGGGEVHFLSHRNWKFEKIMSEKIQTNNLERIEATSADNVLMNVQATVNWRIVDVEMACRMSAETMAPDGSEQSRANDDMRKLRNDVLKQAEASLSSFMGTVNYSDTFGMAAASKVEEAIANDGSPLFNIAKLKTAVEHANEVTQVYGIQIISINIISARPADRELMTSLARGAVAAAEAQQAETAARGNAKAAQITAEGVSTAEVIKAKGVAEAEKIRAEGSKSAADLLASSDVAVSLAKIGKTGDALGDKTTFFFGSNANDLGNVLSNPAIVK